MAEGRFVSYLRVSTAKQGHSGLGLEAQRAAVAAYLNGGNWSLLAEHVEVESGRTSDRPELAAALAACRLHNATLVIAKMDRLARDAHFLLGLQKAGIDFVAADMPNANRLTVGIMALVAEEEARAISARTRAALAAAKARGVRLGTPRPPTPEQARAALLHASVARTAKADRRATDYATTIAAIRAEGVTSASATAQALTARGVPLPSGKAGSWQAVQVQRLLARLGRSPLA
ncbi:recombinase family protein [Roseomonas sp. PWR1]|uniref:Recombinase family protein n=1 Tax=Roseomonas nitratireducens TaxID=2820810 RepID=A0ABS4AWZ1_9PROT|nr:recombinase family protein [Neoroseomonas nitratireducens]MBP0465874.1 recombinase family protein [Neoroseomonas nitratireducens]